MRKACLQTLHFIQKLESKVKDHSLIFKPNKMGEIQKVKQGQGISISKVTILPAKAHDPKTIGLSREDFLSLFKPEEVHSYVELDDRVFFCKPYHEIPQGSIGLLSTQLPSLKNNQSFILMPFSQNNRITAIKVKLDVDSKAFFTSSKKFKKFIKKELENALIEEGDKKEVSYRDVGDKFQFIKLEFTSITGTRLNKGFIQSFTKIKLDKNLDCALAFQNKVYDSPSLIFDFKSNRPLKGQLSAERIFQELFNADFNHMLMRCQAKVTILEGNKEYHLELVNIIDRDKRLKLQLKSLEYCTLRRESSVRFADIESSLKSSDKDLLGPSYFSESIPSLRNSYVPPKPALVEDKLNLRQFLLNEGVLGLPDDLETALSPVIDRFNPLIKEIIELRKVSTEKGIILYGPPGTGKTSFARAIAKFLNCEDRLTMISATELISSQVGSTEKAIRDLFAPAKKNNLLHVIVIDEIDAILTKRTDAKNQWEKTQVNQVLTEMDGLKQISNILVIGITNHLDTLDEAIIRPGRFGIKIEISSPNKQNREEIIHHYLTPLKPYLAEIKLKDLIEETEGFTGADIKGMVESVNRMVYTRIRRVHEENPKWTIEQLNHCAEGQITQKDFISAIAEIKQKKR